MIKVSASGKLFISGEWAILEIGNPAIVAAIDKRIFVEIKDSKDDLIHISIEDFNIKDLKASFDDNRLNFQSELTEKEAQNIVFIKTAIESVLNYLGKWKPFEIKSWGEKTTLSMDNQIKKIGFGSSAAAVTATVAALLKYHSKDITKRESKNRIYKLSTIAHYFAQGNVGTACDIAASTYGGIIIYKTFDPVWLKEQLEKEKELKYIVDAKWPGFHVETLTAPKNFELVVGWTKDAASTSDMVKKLTKWKYLNKNDYNTIITNITDIVEELIVAWKNDEKEKILELIITNEEFLKELGQKSSLDIETRTLKKLCEIADMYGGAGKLSGAGGGDCGIAICFNKEIKKNIENEWENTGIIKPLEVSIDFNGVKEEKS